MDSLNTIPSSGSFGDVSAKLNDNFSKVGQSLTTLENVAIANKGYFDTLASLQAAFPSPKAGNIAYVANAASSTGYYIYNVVGGVWTATTTKAPSVGVDLAEYTKTGGSNKTTKDLENDLTQLDGKIKTIKENMSSLSIACFYISIPEMQADDSPNNQNTGEPLLIGELAAISNPDNQADPDNGKVYAWTGDDWLYMGTLNNITSMQFTNNFFDAI